jgi:AcrR family transcriptional regulator
MDRRDAILDAAVALADEHGLAAVSMRSVAARVGLTPMALYPHIGSKAALLDGMMGRILGELLPTSAAEADWRERLTDLAHAARRLTKQRPWAATLLLSRPSVAPDSVRVVDGIYQALLEAGVPDAEVPRLERLVSTFVLGYGASETGGRFDAGTLDQRARRGQLPEGDLPAHARLAPWLDARPDWDAEFDADLADLQQLIEAKVRQAAQ